MYLSVPYVPFVETCSTHVWLPGLPTYLFICPSARLSASQRKLTYPIAYSVQRIGMYLGGMYTFPASPLILSLVRPFHPVPSHLSHLLSSPPPLLHLPSSPFYSSTPSPTRRPEEFSRRSFCPVTREDRLRYDSWAWLVLEGGGGTGEAFGGRRYRGAFVLHCIRLLAGVP